jgi:hypothetical protein
MKLVAMRPGSYASARQTHQPHVHKHFVNSEIITRKNCRIKAWHQQCQEHKAHQTALAMQLWVAQERASPAVQVTVAHVDCCELVAVLH